MEERDNYLRHTWNTESSGNGLLEIILRTGSGTHVVLRKSSLINFSM